MAPGLKLHQVGSLKLGKRVRGSKVMAWGGLGSGERLEDGRGRHSLSRVRTQREDTERKGVKGKWGDGGCVGYTLLPPPNFRKTAVPPFSWFRVHI